MTQLDRNWERILQVSRQRRAEHVRDLLGEPRRRVPANGARPRLDRSVPVLRISMHVKHVWERTARSWLLEKFGRSSNHRLTKTSN